MRQYPARAAGFGLLENLVALCVVTAGLLALLHLHVAALRANRAALQLGQAVALANDLAERMRANGEPANAYDCGGPCVAGAGGNSVAIADLHAWLADIAARLPEGGGAVSYRAARDPGQYQVTVSWADAAGHGQRTAHTLRVQR